MSEMKNDKFQVEEFGNLKKKKATEKEKPPAFHEICEPIFELLDSRQEVPMLMWAKLLKFGILGVKALHAVLGVGVSVSMQRAGGGGGGPGSVTSGKSAGSELLLLLEPSSFVGYQLLL